jgi:hypothetical protein
MTFFIRAIMRLGTPIGIAEAIAALGIVGCIALAGVVL